MVVASSSISARLVASAVLSLACIGCCAAAPNAVVTNFTAVGRTLYLSVSPGSGVPTVFQMKGFSYSNYRIGEGPNGATDGPAGFDSMSRVDICAQDFPKMRAMGANAIKIYDFNVVATGIDAQHQACLDLVWNNGTDPIFVILSVYITTLPFASPAERANMSGWYEQMVTATADHPAVMGYSVGSEIAGDPNDNPPYWSDFNVIASQVIASLAGRQKIVTTGTYQADCTSCNPVVPCLGHVINGEKYGAQVDVWGVDIYSPDPQMPELRQNIFQATTKPFFLPEYGVTYQPPLNTTTQTEVLYQQVAGLIAYSYNASNTNVNQGNVSYSADGPVYSGGLIFEWIDEYWKGGPLCTANPATAQPYYGVNQVALRNGCSCGDFSGTCATDHRIPRPIVSLLPSLWVGA